MTTPGAVAINGIGNNRGNANDSLSQNWSVASPADYNEDASPEQQQIVITSAQVVTDNDLSNGTDNVNDTEQAAEQQVELHDRIIRNEINPGDNSILISGERISNKRMKRLMIGVISTILIIIMIALVVGVLSSANNPSNSTGDGSTIQSPATSSTDNDDEVNDGLFGSNSNNQSLGDEFYESSVEMLSSKRWDVMGQINFTVAGSNDAETLPVGGGRHIELSDDGTIIAISTLLSGRVYVYRYENSTGSRNNTGSWKQMGGYLQNENITSSDVIAWTSISGDGNVVALSTANGTSSQRRDIYGAVQIFQYNDANSNHSDQFDGESNGEGSSTPSSSSGWWSQMGQTLIFPTRLDVPFRVSLSVDGKTAAIGKIYELTNPQESQVRVYQYNPDTNSWQLLGDLIDGLYEFGSPMALSSSSSPSGRQLLRLAVGAISYLAPIIGESYNYSTTAGAVQVFEYDDSTSRRWSQLGQTLYGSYEGGEFGHLVSLSGNGATLAVASHRNDVASGLVKIFRLVVPNDINDPQQRRRRWIQIGSDINGDNRFDLLGYGMSLSRDGRVVVVGAPDAIFAVPPVRAGSPFFQQLSGGYARAFTFVPYNSRSSSSSNAEEDDTTTTTTEGDWVQVGGDNNQDLQRADNEILGFGSSVSVSSTGDIIAVLSTYESSGYVRIYKQS